MSPETEPEKLKASDLETPLESLLLKAAYKKSGLTVADIATAAGLSLGTIHIALSGVRYREGKPHVAVLPDRTLVKIASVLGISPDSLRTIERDRAAELLQDAHATADRPEPLSSDQDAQAVAAGRQILTRQILAVFSTEELRAEIERRER